MGRMKDLFIEQRNLESLDDQNNMLEPPPNEIDLQSGRSMWIINGSQIWAESYERALELLPYIESHDSYIEPHD